MALKTLVCAPNQRPNLLVLKFYLELIDHSPWKEGKKISYFSSRISFLYFMTQNQDLTLSFALQSGLGSWPVYLFWKLSLKKNVLQILSNQHTMKYWSPPVFFSWGLPQFLYHVSFWNKRWIFVKFFFYVYWDNIYVLF